MYTRLMQFTLSIGASAVFVGCEDAPFSYYPHHERAVACEDVHKSTDPGAYGGSNSRYTSSTAGTNPATGPAATVPAMPANR